MALVGQHVLSIDQFKRAQLESLLEVGAMVEPIAQRKMRCNVLSGAVMANLFFEASTRTRLSFHTAFARLGGSVSDTTGFTFSSISKGESLRDTARVIAGYADAIVMRHPDIGSVAEFARGILVPIINAGDGAGEHPTQALLDYYTIYKEFSRLGKKIDGMSIAMVGDLKHGRTIHSLCKLLQCFENIRFHLVCPDNLRLPKVLIERLKQAGHRVYEYDNLQQGLAGADVIYATRIQKERFANPQEADMSYGESLRIHRDSVARYGEKEVVIMHPLPRDSREGAFDLSEDLDELSQLAIFRQADNGVTMRMALFACVLGVENQLTRYLTPNRLFVPTRYSEYDAPFYRFDE